jgi:hypothetical protein
MELACNGKQEIGAFPKIDTPADQRPMPPAD